MCELCDIRDGRKNAMAVLEDEHCIAVLEERPAAVGHMRLFPKSHIPILEELPDELLGHLSVVANRLSIAAFESLAAKGVNTIIRNGLAAGQTQPHVSIEIIPRREGDGLSFDWKGKTLTEEELSTIELKIKSLGKPGTPKSAQKAGEEVESLPEPDILEDESQDNEGNYLLKHIERIP